MKVLYIVTFHFNTSPLVSFCSLDLCSSSRYLLVCLFIWMFALYLCLFLFDFVVYFFFTLVSVFGFLGVFFVFFLYFALLLFFVCLNSYNFYNIVCINAALYCFIRNLKFRNTALFSKLWISITT